MSTSPSGEVPVTFAKGVLEDVAELTRTASEDDRARQAEAEALKRRIAELLVECKANPFVGELMGSGLHPELAECRRVRFACAERGAWVSFQGWQQENLRRARHRRSARRLTSIGVHSAARTPSSRAAVTFRRTITGLSSSATTPFATRGQWRSWA
jgi:Txe/YoeB family toxin of Txe-Axe toxin-antitoxin module